MSERAKELTGVGEWFPCMAVGRMLQFLTTWASPRGCLSVLMTRKLAFPRMLDQREREIKRERALSVTQTNLGIVREKSTQRCKYQKVGVTGDHIGDWLPHLPNQRV